MILDAKQREEALDPQKSFIVQAPAGSGKTELLTQRCLVLLAQVKQPEEVLAITFTKKSAAEMRTRIIHSLNTAAQGTAPSMPHAKKTWDLAQRILQRSHALQWNLLDNPNRLRIQTIDSFNAYLTKQLPILSQFGAPPEIMDDPAKLYRLAVQEFLSHLEENVAWSDSIAQLLKHMDNDLNKVQSLLINMLARRDQWLPYISLNVSEPNLREKLEENLASVSEDILSTLSATFPAVYMEELIQLANFAADNLKKENSSSKITHCAGLFFLTHKNKYHKDQWLGIAHLLLTTTFAWRKRVDKSIGFPAPTGVKNLADKTTFIENKQRMLHLIDELSQSESLQNLLEELIRSPHDRYQEIQWETLAALHQVLRIVVAQLKLVFQIHGKIDYIESAQAALMALGTEDAPTDMTLALDCQIKHILIDEFQDTSNSQYRLLEKLIYGWERGDGRTLFLVGDPMQSVYRFREAEVGLFIRARQQGIGNVPLIPLTLTVNFRSLPGIVTWVNQHFNKVLPSFEDISMGAVAYSASIAAPHSTSLTQPSETEAAVQIHPFIGPEDRVQAETIVQLIHKIQQERPLETIALLVRSRTHLTAIIPALKQAQINYRAIDIDPLNTRPVIQDLMALTRALLHPADRIAWLSILRAPWCGLTLSDLLNLCGSNASDNLYIRLSDPEVFQQISTDGQQRIARILPILKTKMSDRYRVSLRLWLESTWLALGGPACVSQISDLDDANAYFNLLDKLEENSELFDLDDLDHYVSKLYAQPNNTADNSLQIMTIHNAKGLEFDNVILPHLERKSPNDEKQLLLWMERPKRNSHSALILAPVNAIGQESDSIYEYIKRQQGLKNHYENGRLLYVAATRAKKQLHLLFSLDYEDIVRKTISRPVGKSLLEKLWNSIEAEVSTALATKSLDVAAHVNKNALDMAAAQTVGETENLGRLNRLTLEWQNSLTENNSFDFISFHQKKSGFLLADNNPRYLGIVIHQVLQQICRSGPSWWLVKSLFLRSAYLKNHFIQMGMLPAHHDFAVNNALLAIQNTLGDVRGQWIIESHTDAQSELRLTVVHNEIVHSLVIDRTFVDPAGTRWIIDYKTSAFSGENLDTFLNAEQEKYLPQMRLYTAAIRELDSRPTRLGLYFPLIPAWQEWVG